MTNPANNTTSTGQQSFSVGETLVQHLEQQGVSIVFGIPGVHTVELYRGLAASGIRHITPRHEQGAGFMADGYARASGKPGVAFIITGPGVTNILTPMAQALADSVPMLVISSVNEEMYLGKGLGHLHELPDQHGLCSLVALRSEHISSDADLLPALETTFDEFVHKTPGPRHIQIPLDLMGKTFKRDDVGPGFDYAQPPGCGTESLSERNRRTGTPLPEQGAILKAQTLLSKAAKPLILAGGGSLNAEHEITELAGILNAPVVQTINARGQMHGHPLKIPASPSLTAVRELIGKADVVLAVGTQLGPTDYDIYHTGELPEFPGMIRVDISPEQLARHEAEVKLCGDARGVLNALLDGFRGSFPLPPQGRQGLKNKQWGAEVAKDIRNQALAELSPDYIHMVKMMEVIRDTLPGSIIVGDSTQPIYAANMYYGHDHPRGWFNASTGYGALGFAIPAAIGAQLAEPDAPVVCITGDGGAQFTLPELMVAVDEKLPVIFVIWNNRGYQEIETSMAAAGVDVVGCDPTPPNFADIARANYMPHLYCENTTEAFAAALPAQPRADGPVMIEITA